ncbi:hypothetical protein [Priestia aryabhattai]|nr:hypothetical protein [Priestia aryabhattai]WDW09390.1 hypothetical protein PWC21_02085 [Priestia aryabhattai]
MASENNKPLKFTPAVKHNNGVKPPSLTPRPPKPPTQQKKEN